MMSPSESVEGTPLSQELENASMGSHDSIDELEGNHITFETSKNEGWLSYQYNQKG